MITFNGYFPQLSPLWLITIPPPFLNKILVNLKIQGIHREEANDLQ